MSAKILPKYAADTRICTPFWPSSTSSLTLSPLSKEPLRLLVARVRLTLRDVRQRRSLLLHWTLSVVTQTRHKYKLGSSFDTREVWHLLSCCAPETDE